MRKSIKKNKKTLLMAAVLSALEVGSVVGNVGLPMANVAEAADNQTYPEIAFGRTPIYAERNEWQPGLDGDKHEWSSGKFQIGFVTTTVKWNPNENRFGVYNSVKLTGSSGNGTVDNQINAVKESDTYNAHGEWHISASDTDIWSHVTHTASADFSHLVDTPAYTVAKMLNENIKSGIFVSEEKIKNIIKESGIDATGDNIIVSKPMDTKDINANGSINATGEITAGDTIHGKGNLEIDGDSHIKGGSKIEKNQTVHGDERFDGNLNVGNDATFEKNVLVKGSQEVNGDSNIHGSQSIDGTLHTKDDAEFDKDVSVHGSQSIDKDLNAKGNSTLGDSDKDTLTVNATSEFKADATFDKNVKIGGDEEIGGNSRVHGSSEVDGDQTVHGSENVGKDLTVQGNSDLKGNVRMENDLQVDGNILLGNDKSDDTVDIWAKTNIHGDTNIGDSDNDKLTVNSTSEFNADASFNNDIHVKGNAEVDKNIRIHGNIITEGDHIIEGDTYMAGDSRIRGNEIVDKDLTVGGNSHIGGDLVLDGQFFAKDAAQFGDNLSIAKDLTVGGDAKIDGDVYGKSFNIGNEKYIDADGINANNHKIRNVADGEIGPNSLDAVNGRQLWHTREALQHNLNQVGAGAAAMASLHPLDYEHDDKLSVSAAMGNYKDKTAMAVGAFYRPNIKSMINLSGTLGYDDNMFGIGVTTKMGKVTEADTMTDEQLRDKVSEIHDENKELREENSNLKSEVSDLKEKIAKFNKQDTAQEKQIAALTAKNADIEKAYIQLISKVDGMAAELASLKADSQK